MPGLPDLAAELAVTAPDRRWSDLYPIFRAWAAQPDVTGRLRWHLRNLSPLAAAAVAGRSRETTTHFAWCLRDRSDERFSFWIHEYKPQRDWRPGYADSVHNHRYHFCTTLLRGGYVHERHRVTVDPVTELITSVELVRRRTCVTGDAGYLTAEDYHRIPGATDDTLTFVVKSRPVTPWSLSYDPSTRTGHRHVPVESRLAELTGTL